MSFRRPAGSFRLRERGKGEGPRPFSFSAFKAPAGSRQPDELSPHCRPSAEKARRLGAKRTKEQGLAGVCAPSPRRPSAEKVRRLGAKGTKEKGFAGIRAPSPCRPSWRPIAGKALCLRCEAPTFYPEAQPVTGRVGAPLPAKPCASVTRRQHFTLRLGRQPAKFALGCPQSQ